VGQKIQRYTDVSKTQEEIWCTSGQCDHHSDLRSPSNLPFQISQSENASSC